MSVTPTMPRAARLLIVSKICARERARSQFTPTRLRVSARSLAQSAACLREDAQRVFLASNQLA